jgi:hypothetical protein
MMLFAAAGSVFAQSGNLRGSVYDNEMSVAEKNILSRLWGWCPEDDVLYSRYSKYWEYIRVNDTASKDAAIEACLKRFTRLPSLAQSATPAANAEGGTEATTQAEVVLDLPMDTIGYQFGREIRVLLDGVLYDRTEIFVFEFAILPPKSVEYKQADEANYPTPPSN